MPDLRLRRGRRFSAMQILPLVGVGAFPSFGAAGQMVDYCE